MSLRVIVPGRRVEAEIHVAQSLLAVDFGNLVRSSTFVIQNLKVNCILERSSQFKIYYLCLYARVKQPYLPVALTPFQKQVYLGRYNINKGIKNWAGGG